MIDMSWSFTLLSFAASFFISWLLFAVLWYCLVLYHGECLLYSGTVWCYTMVSKLAILGEGPSYYPVLINGLVHLVTSLSFLTTMKVDIKCGNVWIKRIIMKCICLIQPLLSLPQCMCMPCQSVCLI